MVRPVKTRQIPHLREQIKDTAWQQIALHGAPALSLRAIARELHITAPAIYNYFPDRDALVTALIIDAYTSFGDWQLQARDGVPEDNPPARLQAIGAAYRSWAHAYPQRYQLIFGTPLPAYQAPLAEVLPSAARSLSALVSVIEDLRRAGQLQVSALPRVHPEYAPMFEQWNTYGGDVDRVSLTVAMLIWARVHGIVSLELAGSLPPFGAKGDELYQFELDSIREQFIQQ